MGRLEGTTHYRVTLHVYDLSQGMAQALSPQILGKQIDGIWHTGVVVHGLEFYFSGGICSDPAGGTPYGTPVKRMDMGTTAKTKAEFMAYLTSINHRFTMSTYHILNHNCNNFSDTILIFLTSRRVPQYILDLPRTAMESPLGPLLEPMLNQMQSSITAASQGHQIAANTSPTALSSDSLSKAQPLPSSPHSTLMKALQPLPTVHAPPTLGPIITKLKAFAPSFTKHNSISHLLSLLTTLTPDQAFPALDLLRIHALSSTSNAREIESALSETLISTYILAPTAHAPARLMTLRACVNVSAVDVIACESLRKCKLVYEAAVKCLEDDAVKIRLTAPLLIINLAKGGSGSLGEGEGVSLVWAVAERLDKVDGTSNEARGLLLALGALLLECEDDLKEVVNAIEVDLTKFVKESPEKRVQDITREIQQLLA